MTQTPLATSEAPERLIAADAVLGDGAAAVAVAEVVRLSRVAVSVAVVLAAVAVAVPAIVRLPSVTVAEAVTVTVS